LKGSRLIGALGDALGAPRLARLLQDAGPKILLYHGVEESPLRWNRLAVEARAFERQLLFLRRERRPVSLGELVSALRSGRPADGMVALCFDDGLRNNLTQAVPLLRRHGVPATLFVATYHCDDRRLLWFNKAKLAFLYFPSAELSVLGRRFRLGSAAGRRRSLQSVLDAASALPLAELMALDRALPDPADFAPPEVFEGGFRGLSRDELATLRSDPLIEIGAHTRFHPFLSRCTDAEIEAETEEGRAYLESAVGIRPRFFSYPAGDYDHRAVRVAKRLGFEAAFCVVPRFPDADGPFQLPRTGIYDGSSTILALKCLR
jgi:peptidoglycan/xylan/chitin deacetylase (PgdA/CDA1 family)